MALRFSKFPHAPKFTAAGWLCACLIGLGADAARSAEETAAPAAEIQSAELLQRVEAWDGAWKNLRRDVWRVQLYLSTLPPDLRNRSGSEDLRSYVLVGADEAKLLTERQKFDDLAHSDIAEKRDQAVRLLWSMETSLTDQLSRLSSVFAVWQRWEKVWLQRQLWLDAARTEKSYRVPDAITLAENEIAERLKGNNFDADTANAYAKLQALYAEETRQLVMKSAGQRNSISTYYTRRLPCPTPAAEPSQKPVPSIVKSARPEYSNEARQAGQEGVTYLQVLVDTTGCVARYGIAISSGWAQLDDAAIDWAEAIQFSPATLAGKAESVWVTVPLVFRLTD